MTARAPPRPPEADPVADLRGILARYGTRRPALMDVLREVQRRHRHVPPPVVDEVARAMGIPRWEVEGFVSFYDFLTHEPTGAVVIRVCDDVVDRMKGFSRVMEAFQQALDIPLGGTTRDGRFTLLTTSCIGLSDQAPAALVEDVPVTHLATDRAWEVVRSLRQDGDPGKLVKVLGDGNNAHPLVHAMVKNHLQEPGPVLFTPSNRGEALAKAVAMSPQEVIRAVKAARLRGRGGAGFPTGMKLEFTRASPGERRFVFCNADEGEPGTFKDRVLLTERPDRVFAGLTICGYAVGAREGVVYLRGEYAYLRPFLEHLLEARRDDGLLGRDVAGRTGFDFDIRIQMGAGAYVCGEESALLNSCEGVSGDPRNRPPFPARRGFLGFPTAVHNVETLACVTRILEDGPGSFAQHGTRASTGTKALSVSGDCWKPGVYELPFGTTLEALLARAGASEARAVQVGGPSGRLVGPADFGRRICFDDLATGGAVVVFGPDRNLLEVVRAYQGFFAHESCGYCTPCRAGNPLLARYLDRFLQGRADEGDLRDMERVARTMRAASRCGLGATAGNPALTALESFPELFSTRPPVREGQRRAFDLDGAVAGHQRLRGEPPTVEALPDWAE